MPYSGSFEVTHEVVVDESGFSFSAWKSLNTLQPKIESAAETILPSYRDPQPVGIGFFHAALSSPERDDLAGLRSGANRAFETQILRPMKRQGRDLQGLGWLQFPGVPRQTPASGNQFIIITWFHRPHKEVQMRV